MNDKVAFIAVGQAGGNIGRLFEHKGYSVLYINTSKEDLETLEDAKYRYHIPGGEGCNKDRRKAKQIIIEDFDRIAAEVEGKIKADLVFIVFASGGGTGSGAGPMLMDLLIGEGRTVGGITVLPDREESVKSQINAYECFGELTALDGTAAVFVLDNDKGEKLKLNEQFMEAFCSFLEIPERHKSLKGNIDKAEVEETLRAHGMSMVVKCPAGDSAVVIDGFRENIYAPMEWDGTVKYITASLAGAVRMTDLEKAVGVPVDTFQTFNEEENVCCISGLTYPQTRLDSIYESVEQNREIIRKNLAAVQETTLKQGVNFLEGLDIRNKPTADIRKPQSKRDIMSKYL